MMSNVLGGVGRTVSSFTVKAVLTVCMCIVACIVAILAWTTIDTQISSTPEFRFLQCAIPFTRDEECPQFKRSFEEAIAERNTAIAEAARLRLEAEAEAQAILLRADVEAEERLASVRREEEAFEATRRTLEGPIEAFKRVSDGNHTFSIFTYYEEGPGPYTVVVSTSYRSLWPVDGSPDYGCYVSLDDDPATGANRHVWFKTRGSRMNRGRSLFERAGISQALQDYALSVCSPTLISSAS